MAQIKTPLRDIMPEPTLRRLPWYLAYVSMLKARNVEYVSSTAISKEINVEATQIAKDLSFLNIRGKTRIGYAVAALERVLRSYLGFNREHNAVIIGVGSLGRALITDSGLTRYGLDIVAGFDVNPEIIGTSIMNVPVFDIKDIAEVRKNFSAEIAIITVPVEKAQQTADLAIAAGAKALWNFTPFRIKTPEGIVVQNTSIYAHLAVMYNRLSLINT
ncbi:MAG: redox-sensing transcriptional repressor Rex [Paramuribaculum sp.]|nr:redox-sensing transcriptional repressor Rex [Paramuribaculum sp.]MDE6461121.1 redox-sensing transcriptional repressor Rex [Paramuribaculum sp.]MDE6651295.1 redox-sensing transcriptional repressor Rex [Paramuribaculum sp.]